ncbi:tyrosine-type recombinase/integrase [Variovorax guangxiensis]|uniref:Site-specific integrase n=1 Tax=Variovorax guangxiensis TaxID=1775474 RepID=A0A502DK45_9BURK|nr:site-specific integrase [Variovorax guangxiensis]TPG20735.1 site-specific integrase [Variovorax ginsengisoli]TPG25678.1 site-specific integrase [Variovorax guangxiensis]
MLTDKHCKNAACPPDKKRARFTDALGLYLEVSPAGSKRWFWKTYSDGKEGRMALGSYPSTSLADARKARDAAKMQKSGGIDPVQARKLQKLKSKNPTGDTFKVVALEWYAKQEDQWSLGHADRLRRQLERDLFPWLGERRLCEIEPVELLATLRKVEERGAIETADRGLMLARQVWCYGVATGRVERDITVDLKGALQPYRGRHFAAITEPARFGELLRAIRAYKGGPIVRTALQLAPMLFQRPGELRAAAWAEIDLDAALWTIPSARMKREKEGKEHGGPHLVPLPTQAVAVLRDLHRLTGHGVLVFPGERSHDRPISENSVRTALITMGYTPEIQTWHGFRATARTMLAEVLEVDPLVIEAQLAHAVKDANGRAYNRTQYVNQRRQMMQRWADYLDALRMQNSVAAASSGRKKP